MNRKDFIRSGVIALPVVHHLAASDEIEEFVRAGHNDLEKVQEMLKSNPSLIYASYNWGNFDFETALEGASHVGNKEIASLLIDNGARPSLFSLAMLGENESVKKWILRYPSALRSRGPHGFTLLHHTRVGGNTELEKWLLESGLNETKLPL